MKIKYNFIITTILSSVFTYGCYRIFFLIPTTSDVLIEEVWSRAIINRGLVAWYDLLFTFSPAFFPDFLGYFFSKIVFNTLPLKTVYLATLFQIFCLMLGIWMLLLSLEIKKAKAFLITLTIIDFLLIISATYPGMWLWYYSTNDNLSATILGLYCLALAISILKNHFVSNKAQFLKYTLLFSVNAFSIINGRLFVLTFFAPAITSSALLAMYFICLKERKVSRQFIIMFLSLCASYVTAIAILEPYINPYSTLNTKLLSSNGYKESTHNFIKSLYVTFTSPEQLTKYLILCYILVFSYITYDIFKSIIRWNSKKSSLFYSKIFFIIFILTAIGANFLGPIFAGMITFGLASFRYFSTLILLPLIYFFWITVNHGLHTFIYPIIFLLFLSLNLFNYPHITTKQATQKTPHSREAVLADCIDQHAEQFNLKLGIGDYWNSYSVSFLSHKNIWINPVCNNLEPCYALDRKAYLIPPTGNALYNFILVSNNSQFQFTAKSLKDSIPPPDIKLSCPYATQIYIYTQSQRTFNIAIQKAMTPFLFSYGLKDDLYISNNKWTNLHTWKTNIIPIINNKTDTGWAYGAYRATLIPGKYHAEVTLKIKKLAGDGSLAVGFDPINAIFVPTANIYRSGIQTFKKDINVTSNNKNNIWGFWIYNFGNIQMEVLSTHIQRSVS